MERARGQDPRALGVQTQPLTDLLLRTDPAADTTFDWAGWANPQVVIWDSIRPNPGLPHKF